MRLILKREMPLIQRIRHVICDGSVATSTTALVNLNGCSNLHRGVGENAARALPSPTTGTGISSRIPPEIDRRSGDGERDEVGIGECR